jgi:ketosteroid isomerase-like protein
MTTRASLHAQSPGLAGLAGALAALALAGCTPALIPGTPVTDTTDNRAVYGVVRAYATALQAKDAAAVLALVAPDYFDNAGTPSPDDDLDRAALEKALPADLARVDSVKVEVGVKKIEVTGDTATADLYYDAYFRVVTANGPVARRDNDLHQMRLKRVGKDWKIVSGL